MSSGRAALVKFFFTFMYFFLLNEPDRVFESPVKSIKPFGFLKYLMIVVAWPILIFLEYILPIFSCIIHFCIIRFVFFHSSVISMTYCLLTYLLLFIVYWRIEVFIVFKCSWIHSLYLASYICSRRLGCIDPF